MVQRLGPLMRDGGSFVSLTYMASERVIPGYGGGMSSAKAALESDTRTLAFEAGRKFGVPREHDLRRPARVARGERDRHHREDGGVRVGERAADRRSSRPRKSGDVAAFLCSPLASGITGNTVYVDKGYHAMGMAVRGPIADGDMARRTASEIGVRSGSFESDLAPTRSAPFVDLLEARRAQHRVDLRQVRRSMSSRSFVSSLVQLRRDDLVDVVRLLRRPPSALETTPISAPMRLLRRIG